MSREGAGDKRATKPPAAGTPIWVWVIYAFGILAAAIFAFSVLFTLGAVLLSEDVGVTYDVSTPAIVLWGALMLAAVITWLVRRRQR
ncbi:MAG TPA: hypothetical protein VFU99_09490 [Gaiellaceae bacterium]|nr:hypothetical protein [Gaiellaceae bacterium]